jgi:hypothetical protein
MTKGNAIRVVYLASALLLTVVAARTALACSGALGCYPIDGNCHMTCDLTGQDAEYCYYSCECTCTEAQCDSCARGLGLELIVK